LLNHTCRSTSVLATRHSCNSAICSCERVSVSAEQCQWNGEDGTWQQLQLSKTGRTNLLLSDNLKLELRGGCSSGGAKVVLDDGTCGADWQV
jgi:hypothetical protein